MPDLSPITERYRTALQAAIEQGWASVAVSAAALGQEALEADHPLLPILDIHHAVLARAVTDGDAAVAARISGFLAAFLEPQVDAQARLRSDYKALTEEKRALEQLPELLLEGVPAAVYVAPWHGRPGEMLYVSPQSEVLFGYSSLEWIAHPDLWLERLHPEDRDQAVAERVLAQAQGHAFVSEYRLRTGDDRAVWVHDEGRVLRDADGQPQFWQGVLLDITQRKAAEKQAMVDERMRLARELHDSATQTATVLAIQTRTLAKGWGADPAQDRRQIEELQEMTDILLAELRTLLLEMRPLELTRVPLPDLLAQLVSSVRGRTAAAVELAADPLSALPAEVQMAFYRVAQEALNNLVKHARAQTVRVWLQKKAGQIVLTVADDGIGFDIEAVPGGHLGLRGMRERAASIGAAWAVRSAPGQGTEVMLVWPAAQDASLGLALPQPVGGRQ